MAPPRGIPFDGVRGYYIYSPTTDTRSGIRFTRAYQDWFRQLDPISQNIEAAAMHNRYAGNHYVNSSRWIGMILSPKFTFKPRKGRNEPIIY